MKNRDPCSLSRSAVSLVACQALFQSTVAALFPAGHTVSWSCPDTSASGHEPCQDMLVALCTPPAAPAHAAYVASGRYPWRLSIRSKCSERLTSLQGLGFPNIAIAGAVPPVYNAIQQKLLQDSVFSFWLNRNVGGNRGGELVLGGVDNTHFKGEHTWYAACPSAYLDSSIPIRHEITSSQSQHIARLL